MKTHVFLTPMSPDGTPGNLIALEVNDEGPRQYLAPVSPWAANDAALAKLQSQLAAAETDLRHAISKNRAPLEIQRLENIVAGLKADLDADLYPRRQQRQRETKIGRDDAPPANQSEQYMEPVPYFSAAVSEVKKTPVSEVKKTPEAPAEKKTKKKAPGGWEKYLLDLDERLAARALEALRRGETIPSAARSQARLAVHGATCCEGQYKCDRCRAKAAA